MISKFIKDLTSKYSNRHEDLIEAAMEVKTFSLKVRLIAL